MDSHASTVGALLFEPALSAQRLLLMCIGTGISCGIAIDGHLLRYMDGTCGETGHVIVDPTFESRCTCGGRGCLESVASGPAIERAAQMLLSRGATPDDTRQRLSDWRLWRATAIRRCGRYSNTLARTWESVSPR